MSTHTWPTARIQKLERSFAYILARSQVESYCQAQQHSGAHHGLWWNTEDQTAENGPDVAESLEYLEARGLLKRHPQHKHLVRFADDPDAS